MPNKKIKTEIIMLPVPAELFLEAGMFEGDPMQMYADRHMFEVQELDTLSDFDEKLWLTVIDTVTVYADGQMTFKFQSGKTLTSY